MAEIYTKWDITEHLRTKEDVRLYLEAAAEEDPGDGSLIRAALYDIMQAQNKNRLLVDIGITDTGFHNALLKDSDPSFTTVMKVTRALGLQLRFTA